MTKKTRNSHPSPHRINRPGPHRMNRPGPGGVPQKSEIPPGPDLDKYGGLRAIRFGNIVRSMPWRSGSGLSAHLEPGEAGSVMKAPEKLDFQGFWARRKSRILGPPAIFQKPAQIQPAGRRSRHIGQLRPNGLANLFARIVASTNAENLSP